jgi:hypothetical protein
LLNKNLLEHPIIAGIVYRCLKTLQITISAVPANVWHVDRPTNADPQCQTVAGSRIPTYTAGVAGTWKFTTDPNLEQPNDQHKRQHKYDGDLK